MHSNLHSLSLKIGALALVLLAVVGWSEAAAESTTHPAIWLEVTPQSRDANPSVYTAAGAPVKASGLSSGLTMVCWAGSGAAVSCERLALQEDAKINRHPVSGLPVTGAIAVGRWLVEEARISVVPHGLAFRRPFTTPLLWDEESGELVRQVTTDLEGRFELPPLAPGDWLLEVQLPGGRIEHSEVFTLPEAAPHEESEKAPEAFDLGVLTFDEGLRLEVYVTDSAGLPVPHAQVGGAQGPRPLESDFFEVQANEDGLAVVTGLEPDERLSIACAAEGYTWVRHTYETPPASADCTLEALAKLRGTVVDGEDEPVDGATISLAALKEETSTQKDGAFTLHALEPGAYSLSIAAPGFSGRSVELELTAGQDHDLGRLELAPGRDLWVRVLDAETAEPVAGARVEILEPPGAGGGVSDAAGDVYLKTASKDSLVLETQAPGYAPSRDEVSPEVLDGGDPVPLELSRAGYLEVRAWHLDGSPCSGCTATVMGSETDPFRLQTDGQGQVRSGALPPGDYRVTLTRERSLGQVIQVSGGDNVRRATIEPRRTVTVRFGEPAETVRVLLEPTLASPWRLGARGPAWDRLYDPEAEIEIRRQAGEAVRLTLHGPGISRVELAEIPGDFDEEVLRVTIPGGVVQGVVATQEGDEIGPLTLRNVVTGRVQATVAPTPEGVFRIPFLRPGTYVLQAGDRPVTSFAVAPNGLEDLGTLIVR